MGQGQQSDNDVLDGAQIGSAHRWPLWLLALLGLLVSLLVLVLLMGAFGWLQLGTIAVGELEERPDQELLFGLIRNAVTAGAALGVGVTLVLSYRRQRTLEENQSTTARALMISSAAQRTAAEALKLSNKQHQLEVERRSYDQMKDLRERYAAAAEQLGADSATVRMAGVYALVPLSDEWHRQGHDDQRQACIDVLCSYYRSVPKDEDRRDLDGPVREAIWGSVVARLRHDNNDTRWSSTKIDLRALEVGPTGITDIRQDALLLDFSGSNFVHGLRFSDCVIVSGHLQLQFLQVYGEMVFQGVDFSGGRTSVSLVLKDFSAIQFIDCLFSGGRLELLDMAGARVEFIRCRFDGGEIDVSRMLSAPKVKFIDSTFSAEILREEDSTGFGFGGLSRAELVVRGCDFTETSSVIESQGAFDPFLSHLRADAGTSDGVHQKTQEGAGEYRRD